MEKKYASKYCSLEDGHWWFKARRDIIGRIIKEMPKKAKILDVGCSGGVLINALKENCFWDISGIDISEEAIGKCKKAGLKKVKKADGTKTGLKANSFDLIIASDVLEHIKEEKKALKEWKRILKKNGKLLVFVPAFDFLWSAHDVANAHCRRYKKKKLCKTLKEAGFEVLQSGYWNFFLFLPVSLSRIVQNLFIPPEKGHERGDQLTKPGRISNRLLSELLLLENRMFSNKVNFPFGVSIFALAKKSKE